MLPNPGESGSGLSDEIGFGLEHPHYMDDINPQDRVQAAKEHLKGAADDLQSAASAKATEFQHGVEDAWSDAQSRAQTWQAEIRGYIQQNPTKAVFMALGVGFVLCRRLWK